MLVPLKSPGQQCTLRGSIYDDSTGEPLEFVNVFLANTTRGSSTDAHGRFILSGVPMGMHDLVVSQVGYQRITLPIVLGPDTLREMSFRMQPREIRASEVEVRGMDPELRARLLIKFTNAFLGETQNAESCRILNPSRIEFHYEPDRRYLTALCDTLLLVQNDALGYRIAIDIDHFAYAEDEDEVRFALFPHFQPLTGSSRDSSRWAQRRQETYRGSLKHFLASVVAGRWEQEMFAVYSGSYSLLNRGQGQYASPRDVVVLPDGDAERFRISFQGWLR
jgi:hypothetical protein